MLKDAATGEVIAEDGTAIGVATNNVAEYSGLIAGLKLAEEFAPDADIEVRMDSKLVVEQMSGRWKIKHPGHAPARDGGRTGWRRPARRTPGSRASQNAHADRLANEALDGKRRRRHRGRRRAGRRARDGVGGRGGRRRGRRAEPRLGAARARRPRWSWSGTASRRTPRPRSSPAASRAPTPGSATRAAPRSATTAEWLAPIAEGIDAVVASPVRRTLESAEIIAETLGKKVDVEPGFAEMEFGSWDGLTFAEVAERDQAGLDAWLGSLETPPPGGESFREVEERVLAGLERIREAHAGKTVVVVSHVTPIKTLVATALQAPLESVFRMELSPASVTRARLLPRGGREGARLDAALQRPAAGRRRVLGGRLGLVRGAVE